MKKKVVVGMSGGVDSSVAAYLLKEEGYEVIGVTMKIWENDVETADAGSCCGLSAVFDARRVAEMLDIPYYVMNFTQDFKHNVIEYFVNAYEKGQTPNPCIACNRFVKWESLLQKALALGADYIATGHYAQVGKFPATGRYALQISKAGGKDQTYALYNLTQYQLERTLMPLGNYTKPQVREIAEKIGLNVAAKPDSQEICFIPDHDYGRFIQNYRGKEILPGNFVDTDGNVLGRHKGIVYYTVGQRKGLGIALGRPMFVKRVDAEENKVVLAEEKQIFSRGAVAVDLNWAALEMLEGEREAKCKIRYNQQQASCTIRMENEKLVCMFAEPQRAVTPGQALVLYDGNYVLGGGVIAYGID